MSLILLGAGGHFRSCLDVIRSCGLPVAGVLDPDPVAHPDAKWLGGDDWLDCSESIGFQYLVTVGQTRVDATRQRLFDALVRRGHALATVCAASALVSSDATIGRGSCVMHRVHVNTGARVGENCILNSGALIEHDAVIGAHCHIATGAIINGGANVGDGCMIGSGAVVLQGVRIASGSAVGAGAVVVSDIDEAGVWVGVPARRVR